LDSLIPSISARIIKASCETLDEAIDDSLREILQSQGLDRCALLKVSEELCTVMISHALYNGDAPIVSKDINLAKILPWTYHQLVKLGKTVPKYNIDSIPIDAEADRRAFVQLGVKSALAIPLIIGQSVRHIIVVHALKKECVWSESFIAQLRLLGEIFVSALERQDILNSLQRYQARLDIAAASADAVLWDLDLVTGECWASGKARELFGFVPDEKINALRAAGKNSPRGSRPGCRNDRENAAS
jgi:formate hydrogenlyase transcriptional activator